MLDDILNKLTAWRRRGRFPHDLGTRILAYIERRGSIVLDPDMLEELGATLHHATMVAYHLVMTERAHLMDDADGRIVVMSNREFTSMMAIRASGTRETEIRRRDGRDASHGIGRRSDRLEAMAVESVSVEPVEDEEVEVRVAGTIPARPREGETPLEHAPVAARDELSADQYPWFNFSVSFSGADDEGILPAWRKTLPERKREPWPVLEEAAHENEEEAKKNKIA